MDRSDFLKGLALTPFASLIDFSGDKPKPKDKKAEKNLRKLMEAFHEGKPIELFGIHFLITQIDTHSHDHFAPEPGEIMRGRRTVELTLESTGI